MAKLLKPDGSILDATPANKRTGFTLEEMYKLIDCETIQAIDLSTGEIMVIDEESKLRAQVPPRNRRATMLLHVAGGAPDDYIAGNALICSGKEFQ